MFEHHSLEPGMLMLLGWQLLLSLYIRILVGSVVKNPPAMQVIPDTGQEDALEEEMATHSNILAWKIPWTEKPGGYSPRDHKVQTQLSD